MKKINTEIKIDLVCLWVDGNDKIHQEKRQKWAKLLNKENLVLNNNCRFDDNQELRYLLRSAEIYAPWLNKIYIITDNQKPKWINEKNTKIVFVDHKQIMPKDALPTFNSEAIETCIMNIPNLSEYFLFANDDMFFNAPVTPSFFFDKKNNPIVNFKKFSKKDDKNPNKTHYHEQLLYSEDLIKNHYGKTYHFCPHHNIDAYRKSYLIKCKEEFKEIFEKTTFCKFRQEKTVQRIIYQYFMLKNKLCTKNILPIRKPFWQKKSVSLYLNIDDYESMYKKIRKYKPILLCINDNEETTQGNKRNLKHFLNYLYSEKMPWEISEDDSIKDIKHILKRKITLKEMIFSKKINSKNTHFVISILGFRFSIKK